MRHLQSLIPAAFTLLFGAAAQATPTVSVCGFLDTQISSQRNSFIFNA
ncbi:hypothetical protein PMI38_00912 [Pseudomonas sp. GM84]|nr:hypothetical protein [Pseudomonas sp. GM84]EJN39680.1 hypothetical protein PMI38_00912 [Pseudomonas sp. GM84]